MYNINVYYYLKDIEKRIVGIVSGTSVVAKYQYSAYGVIIYFYEESFISGINKYFYKSYYYDNESNMYYLKNRYYSLDILRFIFPDNYNYLNLDNHTNYNLYAYSNNNPIIYYDPDGNGAIMTIVVSTIVGTLIDASVAAVNEISKKGLNPSDWDWGKIGLGALIGGVFSASGLWKVAQKTKFSFSSMLMRGGARFVIDAIPTEILKELFDL